MTDAERIQAIVAKVKAQRDAKAALEVKLSTIKTAMGNVGTIPTLSSLKNFLAAIKEVFDGD